MRAVPMDSEPFCWLKQSSPEFSVKSSAITFVTEPSQFFSILNMCQLILKNSVAQSSIRNASKRITIASLYLGTGQLEQELVSSIQHSVERSDSKFRFRALFDFTRGSRGTHNSRTMLLPLLNCTRRGTVDVALYHTPDLRGIIRRVLPDRWNEIIGLSHMKIYVVDNAAIISGANLSNDYFTNRQDRYVIFKDADLADFLDELVLTVSSFSFHLQPDNTLSLSDNWKIHPFKGSRDDFKREAHKRIQNLLQRWHHIQGIKVTSEAKERSVTSDGNDVEDDDSKVYPLIQMAPFRINHDSEFTEALFCNAPDGSQIYLASGYFNLTRHYLDVILDSSAAHYSILTAAPRASGFFNAKGLAGFIPDVYTYLSKRFYEKLRRFRQTSRVSLFEYERDRWTFHCKGLWYYQSNASLPTLTLIGSPNFGHRSVYRDLEIQMAVVTSNRQLQQQLHLEHTRLYALSTPVTNMTYAMPERIVPLWVRMVSCLFRRFF